jgi:ketosteroid isomerase-like protein
MPQTLKGVGEAFNAHDAKKLSSYFTEDSAVVDYGGRTDHGRDDVASTGDRLFVTFPDAKLAATRVWFKGNVAVTEVVWTGTMSADTMHLKASHKPVGQLRVHVAWFNDDGLIKEEHQYADSAGLLAQMAGKKEAPPVPTLPTSLPEVHVAKGTPDEDKLAEWAKSIDDVWSKDDAKAAVALFADDGDFLTSMGGGPAVKGKKELTKGFTGWAKTFPDQKWTVANAWGVDGFAIVENSVSGTQKGPLGPLAATNKPVSSWHFVEIVQPTADGKIKHLWSYGNVLEAIQQLAPPKDAEHSDAKATSKDGVPKKTP